MNIRKIVKKFIPKKLFRAIEPYGHWAESFVFNLINGFPGRGLKVIAITGTNGKTTTAYMVHNMLQKAGYKTALMSTVAWGIGDQIEPQIQHYTNVPAPEFMKRLKKVRAAKVDYVVLEITSQALAQNRAWGVPITLAVMTNLTHEHLDYHGTFERYRDAKRKLFKMANSNKQGLRVGIINADDPSATFFESDVAKPLTYGVKNGDLRAKKVRTTTTGSEYFVNYGGQDLKIKTHLPGSFNVYNSLATVGVGISLNLTPDQIQHGIESLEGVEGRMARVSAGQPFEVIVDFAHTPDSFEKLFKDLAPATKGRLIVMFGSAGRRDEAKREVQGELAGKYCDVVIVTEEDDRDVNGKQILEQIAYGAEKIGKIRDKNLFLVHDRTEAISFAVKSAKPGDTVLLLGKGHEKTIERAKGSEPWDEIAAAKKALSATKK